MAHSHNVSFPDLIMFQGPLLCQAWRLQYLCFYECFLIPKARLQSNRLCNISERIVYGLSGSENLKLCSLRYYIVFIRHHSCCICLMLRHSRILYILFIRVEVNVVVVYNSKRVSIKTVTVSYIVLRSSICIYPKLLFYVQYFSNMWLSGGSQLPSHWKL